MSESGLQWVVNAYALLFGGFLLLGGRAGDLIGRKRVFLAGLVLFTAASLLCALSTGETMLILARGLQGLGAALVSPAALSIVTTTFREGAERTKALGVWAAIAVGGGAVGLVLGGLLVETLSWPWIFFVNVPVGIAAFVVSLRYVPESKDEHVHKSFDVAGAVTVTGGLIALVYGIVRSAESGWGSGEVLGILALSAVLLVGFVLIERRSAEPLVRLSIFSVKTVRGANVAMFVVAAGLFAMFFFNTLYVQRVLGFSPLEAGFAFVPFTAGVIIGAGLSQKLVPALGAREVPLIGSALGALGLLTLPAADAGLVVRHRPSPRHPADVGRDGARVRADHAHRDERRPASTTPDSRRVSSTRRSRSAARSGSRSCRRSRRTRRRTSSPRSAIGRPRPTRRRRSSAGSTSRGSRARSCSPRAVSCWSCCSAAATSSRSCRARPLPVAV